MKKIFFLVLFVLGFVALGYGAAMSRIELTDGSTVEGEVVSVSEGKYVVKSPSLGMLKIEKSKVRGIRGVVSQVASPTPTSSQDSSPQEAPVGLEEVQQVQKLQAAMAGNPQVMDALPGLMAQPDFQALLKDPEIMKAAKSMDFNALLANQKVIKATQNPKIQEISQKVNEKNG